MFQDFYGKESTQKLHTILKLNYGDILYGKFMVGDANIFNITNPKGKLMHLVVRV